MISTNLLLAYTAYLIGVASPGPSNLAIMSTAMAHGRSHALVLAMGVICGSLAWGLLAAFGLASWMAQYSAGLAVLKTFGGAYLLWLAARTALSTRRGKRDDKFNIPAPAKNYRRTYMRGAAMHLTNPKAIFVWLSIVALAVPAGARPVHALAVVGGCALIGTAVFAGYAIAFSTAAVRRTYQAVERAFNAVLAGVFGYAGLRMLLSNQQH